ncbi:MAG TPA: lysozyme inhibitor LprI family protein [Longimicrobium sp.]|nr:lysozyme inhibitor LprI family protein [Longimicrobium sp.]
MIRTLLLAAALTLAARTAGAQTAAECRTAMEKSSPQTLMNICIDRDAGEAQDRLDALLARLRAGLDPARWKALLQVQRRWVDYQAEHCEFEAARYQGGSVQPFVRALCFIQVTEDRIRQLKGSVAQV